MHSHLLSRFLGDSRAHLNHPAPYFSAPNKSQPCSLVPIPIPEPFISLSPLAPLTRNRPEWLKILLFYFIRWKREKGGEKRGAHLSIAVP